MYSLVSIKNLPKFQKLVLLLALVERYVVSRMSADPGGPRAKGYSTDIFRYQIIKWLIKDLMFIKIALLFHKLWHFLNGFVLIKCSNG